MMLALQMMEARQSRDDNSLRVFEVAIGDQQLCSLIRDLTRAATERNLAVWPKRKRRGLLGLLMKPLVAPRPAGSGRRPELLLLPDFTVDRASVPQSGATPSNENAAAATMMATG